MKTDLRVVFALLVVYQMKHLLADYLLQSWPIGHYFLGKFKKHGWVKPLAGHCGEHAAITLMIVGAMHRPDLWWLAIVDFGVHFVMDRLKAGPRWLGQFKMYPGSAADWQDDCHLTAQPNNPSLWSVARRQAEHRLWSNTLFWVTLGVDQAVHHLTHYYCIWRLVTP